MNLKLITYIAGFFFLMLSLLMLVPAAANWRYHEIASEHCYLYSAFGLGITSLIMILTCNPRQNTHSMTAREILLLTNFIWISAGLASALPIMLAEHVSYTDAVFEAMAGLTTSGTTIFPHLNDVSAGTLLWRSLLQWVGGMGFILLGAAVLPFLKVGGMRLFQIDTSDTSEKILPRSGSIAKRILLVYLILSIICILLLKIEGMPWFDAFNYGMTTISTGGFAPHDKSIAFYDSTLIYWTIIFFMLIGSLPFLLLWRFFCGQYKKLINDSQVRAFITMIIITWFSMTLWLWHHSHYSLVDAFTLIAFDTTSIISTTGFYINDYSIWGHFAVCAFFFLTFIGGCSGSTSGGFKVFRVQIAFRMLSIELKKQSHPRSIIFHQYNGHKINDDILRSLISFSFFYLLAFVLLSLMVSLTNVDFVTAISCVIGILSNSGQALGAAIGPFDAYTALPSAAKWMLTFGMLIGRLEVIAVLILFSPYYWRR